MSGRWRLSISWAVLVQSVGRPCPCCRYIRAEDGAIDREPRIATRCRVEFLSATGLVIAHSEDLSRRGIFVRTAELMPVGETVELVITLPIGARVEASARVAHVLTVGSARALGRASGIGFEFIYQDAHSRGQIDDFVGRLVHATAPPPEQLAMRSRVLVADPQTPLLVRLTNALEGTAGFEVDAVTNGADAFVSCIQNSPKVVLAEIRMDFLNGYELVAKLKSHARLRDVPVILMSDDPSDLTRLEALRIGARDFIGKPFTDEEVMIRLRRLVYGTGVVAMPIREEKTHLNGRLAEISLATLFSLFEFERKSGVLSVSKGKQSARIAFLEGRPISCDGSIMGNTARDRVMTILGWTDGAFDFLAGPVDGDNQIGTSPQELLLEHARLQDEETMS